MPLERSADYQKKPISDISLRSRYSSTFLIITIIFIVLLTALLGSMSYLSYIVYEKDSDKTAKTMSIVVPVILLLVIIVMSVFYFKYILPDLVRADRIATDILRLTTNPMTDRDFKYNLTDLVVGRTNGSRQQIFKDVSNSMLIDPHSYIRDLNEQGIPIEKGLERDGFTPMNRGRGNPNVIGIPPREPQGEPVYENEFDTRDEGEEWF